jgi:porin
MHSIVWRLVLGSFMLPTVAESETVAETSRNIEVASVYTGELWIDEAGESEYLDNLDVTLQLSDTQWSLFGYVLYNNGHSVSGLVDAEQGITNIEATNALRVYELWGEWRFASIPVSVRTGLYDLNSEFDAIENAALFINPSHGIGVEFSQTGAAGPSIFPLTSFAVRAAATLDAWTFRAAVLDGVPDDDDRLGWSSEEGALIVTEVNYRIANGWRFGLGAWGYSADFDDNEPTHETDEPKRRDDNRGTYAFTEGLLWEGETGGELGAFIRVGEAEDRINPVARYFGAGVAYSGLTASQPNDQLGIAVAVAEAGRSYRRSAMNRTSRESIVELTYRFVVRDWLALQTDVQYVRHAAFDAAERSAWVFGLRFELAVRAGVRP